MKFDGFIKTDGELVVDLSSCKQYVKAALILHWCDRKVFLVDLVTQLWNLLESFAQIKIGHPPRGRLRKLAMIDRVFV